MGKSRDMRKAAEECSELTTVLIQQINKPNKDLSGHIIEEIGDAVFRLNNLRSHYDLDRIENRIAYKKKKEAKRKENEILPSKTAT